MIVATAGHVDHGKTLLVEAITGVRTDSLVEEQARGLTIDLGFAYVDIDGERIGFVDVPGHTRFIGNMLAGVSAIDYALLVIAADDGPMPQTSEHLAILDLLGIRRGAVALTKIDRVESGRVQQVRQEIANLLQGTGMERASIFPVSGLTRHGIDDLSKALAQAARETVTRTRSGHFRLAVDRSFSVKGAGLVVTGSVFSGHIAVGDNARLLPGGTPVRIRGIHRQNVESTIGEAGDRCALNIASTQLTHLEVHRGNWITTSHTPSTTRADAYIQVLHNQPSLRNWTPVHIHSAANHVTGRVALLESNEIKPGEGGLTQLVLDEPINLWRGDRVIVRDQAASRSIGGGHIVDPVSPRRGRAKAERLATLHGLLADSVQDRLSHLLTVSPRGIRFDAFVDAECLTDSEARQLQDDSARVAFVEPWAITQTNLDRLSQDIIAAVGRWQTSNPGATAVTKVQLAAMLAPAAAEPILDMAIAHLVDQGALVKVNNGYRPPHHQARLTDAESRLWHRLEPILKESPTRPPVVHELAKLLSMPPKALETQLNRLVQLELLVRPVPNRYFLPAAVLELHRTAIALAATRPAGFTVQEFRDATAIGRNLSIELLEYFDRKGITSRFGDHRKLTPRGLA